MQYSSRHDGLSGQGLLFNAVMLSEGCGPREACRALGILPPERPQAAAASPAAVSSALELVPVADILAGPAGMPTVRPITADDPARQQGLAAARKARPPRPGLPGRLAQWLCCLGAGDGAPLSARP
ncbi:MAG: hypothetical protein HUK26_06290 [Duodenibacillus sp.]|nr:hypothetical protein [Duodenibacillus sp.]